MSDKHEKLINDALLDHFSNGDELFDFLGELQKRGSNAYWSQSLTPTWIMRSTSAPQVAMPVMDIAKRRSNRNLENL